jgi:hypothetical protein
LFILLLKRDASRIHSYDDDVDDDDDNNNNNNNNKFLFVKQPSKQPNGQLQKQTQSTDANNKGQ